MLQGASLMLGYAHATVGGNSGTAMSSWPLSFLSDAYDDGTGMCAVVEASTEVWETGNARRRGGILRIRHKVPVLR